MAKEEIFYKFNIKDYNNKLEKILSKKYFSEDTKNLLLNMLYKIETAYEDYNRVKVNTSTKRETIEVLLKIIENNCSEINLIRPNLNEETILKDKNSIAIKDENKIISYPNEKAILGAIYCLEDEKFTIKNKHKIIKNSMEQLLNEGNKIDKIEMIRDFDGWSWNILTEDISNLTINIAYQNIRILLRREFLKNWKQNFEDRDYIILLKDKLKSNYGEEIGLNIYKLILQISILTYIKKDEKEKKFLISELENMQEKLSNMENKKTYLQKIANSKKEIGKKVKDIDEIISNNQKFKNEFLLQNESLDEKDKIFSMSDFSEILQNNRKKLMLELKEYSKLMEPLNYVKTKTELTEKVTLLKELNLKEDNEQVKYEILINLQKEFLRCMEKRLRKLETKKDIIDIIYEMRYYNLLPLNDNIKLNKATELKECITKLNKQIITKACKSKVLMILSSNIEQNYQMFSCIFESKIIDLEDIVFELKKKDEKIILNIYDDTIMDTSIEYKKLEDLNIKYNKKVKIFI